MKNKIETKDKNIKTKKRKKKKQHLLFYKIVAFLLIVLTVVTCSYTIIEEVVSLYKMIPYMLIGGIVVILFTLLLNSRLRCWVKNVFVFLSFVIMIVEVLFLIYGTSLLKFANTITDTGLRVETYGVYVKSDSRYSKVEDLMDKSLTYYYVPNDTETKEALDKVDEKIDYTLDSQDSIEDLLDYINDDKTNAIFMNTSFESIINEEYPEKFANLKCIYKVDMVNYVKTTKSEKNITKDTFAMYISGIDTSGKVASSARSDVNIVMVVNPNTHQVLLINTPRDYYVDMATSGKKDKLTHAGLKGIEESAKTLGNIYDIETDYYLRVNFTSFIKVINALGGITVNVSKSFCEQDSKRNFDNQICLRKGTQNLTGEQALAYARHRKTLAKGDMSRGENQMDIIEAMVKKAMSPAIIKNYQSIINALSGNIVTNMTSDEMFEFAKKQMSKNTEWSFNMISATGTTGMKSCEALGNKKASVVVPDETSVLAIKNAIKNVYQDKTEILVEDISTTTTKKN